MEYTEWAIEKGLFIMDSNDLPARVIDHEGEDIFDVQEEGWAARERSWAESPTFDTLMSELADEESEDVPETFVAGG